MIETNFNLPLKIFFSLSLLNEVHNKLITSVIIKIDFSMLLIHVVSEKYLFLSSPGHFDYHRV